MNLSAVVVNWNSGGHLRRLLESLQGFRLERIIVVDNGSDDGSCEGLPELRNLEVIRQGRNLGFAAAANHAIGRVETGCLLLLNPDVEMKDAALGPLLDEMRRRPEVAVACPALADAESGRFQFTFQVRALPTLRSVIVEALFLDHLPALPGAALRPPPDAAGIVEVEQPAAACWVLRRQAWEELGGFDEAFYPAWFEDVDFCRRMHDAGWRAVVMPSQRVLHHGGYSVKRLGRPEFTRIYFDNLLRYWRKHHRSSYPLVWLAVQVGRGVRLLMASMKVGLNHSPER